MSSQIRRKVGNNSQQVLRNRAAELIPFVNMDGNWTIRDVEGEPQQLRDYIVLLKQHGAIERSGYQVENNRCRENENHAGSNKINVWQWNSEHKRYILNCLENRDTMPECEHGVHIYNPREIDGFSCRKCHEKGEMPEYSRETIKELL